MHVILAILFLTPSQWVGGGIERYATVESPVGWPPISQFILAGDMNADGTEDLVLAQKEFRNGWRPDAGAIIALSGADRSELFRMVGRETKLFLGLSLDNLGDVNGDNFDDVIVGGRNLNSLEPTHGLVRVLSGAGGTILYEYENWIRFGFLGSCVRGVGDLNQDGFAEFAFLSDDAGRFGLIVVVSGASGLPLYKIDGAIAEGISEFQGVGDLDGDGVADLVSSNGYFTQAASVTAFSGATGARLWSTLPPRREILFGHLMAPAGDMNGDGSEEVLVAAPSWSQLGSTEQVGACYVLSGADGHIVRVNTGSERNGWFAFTLAGGHDFDEDGIPDYLVGASGDSVHGSPTDSGAVHLYSGATGLHLASLAGAAPSSGFGAWIEIPQRPSQGEGMAVCVLGFVEIASSRWVSAVDAWIFRPYLRLDEHEVSAARGGTVRAAADFPESLGGMHYSLLLSASGRGLSQLQGLDIPLTRDAILEATIHGNYPTGTHGGRGTLDAEGKASAEFRLAPGRVPPGRTIHLAVVAWNPATRLPVVSSIAAELRIVP